MKPIVKRLVLLVVSLFLLVYVGFHIYSGFAGGIQTETVYRETAYQTVDTTGLIFRDETIVQTDADGWFFYTLANGNRVGKGGTIADVYPSMQDALRQQELDALNEEIRTLTSINAQGTTNRANLASINQQINELWLKISREVQSSSFTQMDEYRAKLLALLNKKQLTVGKEDNYDARLAQLTAQRDALQQSFAKATATVTSPVAGYFISSTDGFESLLGTKAVEDLSVEQLLEYLSKQATVDSNGIGKVVGDYEWYLACVVPLADTTFIKKDMTVDVKLPFVMERTVPAQVAAVNRGGNDSAAVILKCTHMSDELSVIRKEQVELRIRSYDGLRIPDKAIYFNDKQEAGVYIQDGNQLSFRRIQVSYHDEKERYSICKITDDKNYVQMYDKVVVGGEDLYDGKMVR